MQSEALIPEAQIGYTRLFYFFTPHKAPTMETIIQADSYHRRTHLHGLVHDEGKVVLLVRGTT